MPVRERTDPATVATADRFESGVGWLTHPGEPGRQVSHAPDVAAGTCLLGPLAGPGITDLLAGRLARALATAPPLELRSLVEAVVSG